MTAKEEAKRLVDKFGKDYALKIIDEIFNECKLWQGENFQGWETKRFDYFQEVKQEINKL